MFHRLCTETACFSARIVVFAFESHIANWKCRFVHFSVVAAVLIFQFCCDYWIRLHVPRIFTVWTATLAMRWRETARGEIWHCITLLLLSSQCSWMQQVVRVAMALLSWIVWKIFSSQKKPPITTTITEANMQMDMSKELRAQPISTKTWIMAIRCDNHHNP